MSNIRINDVLNHHIQSDPDFLDRLEFNSWLLEIGLNIGDKRRRKGLSQKEFADLLKIKQGVVSRIESGQNMRCDTIWKVANALGEDINIFNASIKKEKKHITQYTIFEANYKDTKLATTTQYTYNYIKDTIFSQSNLFYL